MTEFIFVVKCLLVTAILTMALQLEWQGVTIETKAERFLEESPAIAWIQSAASGGALALQNSTILIREKARSFFAKDRQQPVVSGAQR